MHKDTRYCKDTRGTKYTYYNGCFLILLLVKSRLGTFPLLQFVYLIYKMKTKDKTIHVLKKNNLNLYKLIILVGRFN